MHLQRPIMLFSSLLALSVSAEPQNPTATAPFPELLIVDPAVPDAKQLVDGLARPMRVVFLDPTNDPIGQIAREVTAVGTPLSALHILSHGAPGALYLSNSWINRYNWRSRARDTRKIADALAPDAVVVFYACQLASDRIGKDFIGAIEASLEAKVYASSLPVGAPQENGDWSFAPEAVLAFSLTARETYPHLLSASPHRDRRSQWRPTSHYPEKDSAY